MQCSTKKKKKKSLSLPSNNFLFEVVSAVLEQYLVINLDFPGIHNVAFFVPVQNRNVLISGTDITGCREKQTLLV